MPSPGERPLATPGSADLMVSEGATGSSLINHCRVGLTDNDARGVRAIALHIVQPAYPAGDEGRPVQLPQLPSSPDLAGRALQEVLTAVQVRELWFRRALGSVGGGGRVSDLAHFVG